MAAIGHVSLYPPFPCVLYGIIPFWIFLWALRLLVDPAWFFHVSDSQNVTCEPQSWAASREFIVFCRKWELKKREVYPFFSRHGRRKQKAAGDGIAVLAQERRFALSSAIQPWWMTRWNNRPRFPWQPDSRAVRLTLFFFSSQNETRKKEKIISLFCRGLGGSRKIAAENVDLLTWLTFDFWRGMQNPLPDDKGCTIFKRCFWIRSWEFALFFFTFL